jgi:hypothetical protein
VGFLFFWNLEGSVQMTSQQITFLRLADMESAVIRCQHKDCGTRVSMNLGTRKQVPENCPACGKLLDVKNRAILVALLEFYCTPGIPAAEIEIQLKATL